MGWSALRMRLRGTVIESREQQDEEVVESVGWGGWGFVHVAMPRGAGRIYLWGAHGAPMPRAAGRIYPCDTTPTAGAPDRAVCPRQNCILALALGLEHTS
jgi:hypothetical protein